MAVTGRVRLMFRGADDDRAAVAVMWDDSGWSAVEAVEPGDPVVLHLADIGNELLAGTPPGEFADRARELWRGGTSRVLELGTRSEAMDAYPRAIGKRCSDV